MGSSQLRYWVGFSIVPQIGPARLRGLLQHFGSVEAAWHADSRALQAAGLDRRALGNLLAARRALDLDRELERLQRAGVTALTWDDAAYPPRLREIGAPPLVLYVRGALLPDDEWAVAVVGTRHPSAYGLEMARQLAGDLARSRITVVSGLARGVDSEAHHAALAAGGRTIAVLGSGLDRIYPPENTDLARQVAGSGAVVSEYPFGTRPEAGNFPARNRIISGLTLGTLVVEAGETSGALITAHCALEQCRETFAVPGSALSRRSVGTNRLLQRGEAKLVTQVQDILEELNLTMLAQQAEVRQVVPENDVEAQLLAHLSTEPAHIDDLSRSTQLPVAQVSSALSLLELKGVIHRVGAMSYVLTRETRVSYHVE
ncbi:MAG TPA: DNA-processing protein DprA [Anaerolineae bacterium]|nr:DNA-processing protein DprA [Anaerolineae bacterium]HPL29049.1 DNA-processing protein DprA [Anaerolineae bacterium]